MSAAAVDAGAVHRRAFGRILLTAVPTAIVAAYVVGPVLGIETGALLRGLPVTLGFALGLSSPLQFAISGALVRRALADPPGELAGARLARILALPRKIEIWSNGTGWLAGGLLFGVAATWMHGIPASLVAATALIAFGASLFPGLVLVMLLERDLRPFAVAELERHPDAAPRGDGLFWPRQRWYLPYAFGVAIVSLLCFSGLLVYARYRDAAAAVVRDVAVRSGAQVAEALRLELDGHAAAAAGPVLVVAIVLLAAFGATGVLLARRQSSAAEAVEASLRAMAAGAPEPPRWASTDEVGDLAAATAAIGAEMRRVFEQLRAMAAGDLGRELHGDSGLVLAFRRSREGMIDLAARMEALSRGEALDAARIAGDLGGAFDELQNAFRATVDQARTIAEGDLRRDVEAPGALGQALQRMTGNLRGMVGRTQSVSGDVRQIVVSLQSAATQLSAATTEQVAAVTETANTMTEMAQTSAVSADRASELIRQGEGAASVVEEGTHAVESVSGAMTDMTASLDEVAKASAALADRVRKIDTITETVTFLADQSSTLAINAAIEAARAGEAGKGFSVVAREIRALAADSRKAAAQIKELLDEVRQRTDLVDASVNAGGRKAADTNKLVVRLGEVISQLGVTIHDAVGLMRQVEGSARQHQAGVGQVSAALGNMQKASESIRDGARLLGELSGKAHELSSTLQAAAGAYRLPEARA
ncbi:MAG TPA: methyl-accepting chemotaxis protein [Anaeromyxobacter sp.]|nr:methyl-accepting chemotaxis protein [Anaeromyxobacter sp.]